MNVSVVYVNYKTVSLILNSIESIKKHTNDISYEIIVVDNNSGDNSEKLLTSIYPEVVFIQAEENLGFGKANNLGVDVAKGEMVLFLNPDTLLENDAISEMYLFLKKNQLAGACGGNLVDIEGKPTFSLNRFDFSLFQEFLSIFYLRLIPLKASRSIFYNYESKPLSVRSIIGADLMVRMDLIKKIGAFDPDFFMNGEDIEFCYRILHTGYKIYSLPTAKIVHFEGRSSYIKNSRLQLLYEGNYMLFKKIYSFRHSKCLYYLIHFKSVFRRFIFKVLGNKEKQEYWNTKKNVNVQAWNNFLNKCNIHV
ncbi:MAG: glycosyltransferase family 2 protein [Parabacteroides sp.]|nr:glycosyltransferase family 2 protein [Parabacteroides sp.]